MNGAIRESGGMGLIVLLVVLYIIFNPIPGPIDDVAVAARKGAGTEQIGNNRTARKRCGILRPDWRSGAEPDRKLEEWDNILRFGVRVDRPGTIEKDYRTVQGRFWKADIKIKTDLIVSGAKPGKAYSEPPHLELTWHDYLHDASFLVALASDDHSLLRQFSGELDHPDWPGDLLSPKWPFYVGRKSCVPLRQILARLAVEYPDIESALRAEPWCVARSPR